MTTFHLCDKCGGPCGRHAILGRGARKVDGFTIEIVVANATGARVDLCESCLADLCSQPTTAQGAPNV